MKAYKIFISVAIWIACGVFNYGHVLGKFTHDFPDDDNRGVATAIAIAGPLGVIPVLITCGPPYHWRLHALSVEERWEYFHKRWPSLDREYFERMDN